jgi:insulysin
LQYCFEIAPEAFDGALDRFAGFFTTPLFDASRIEREVNVVNAEQNKNLQNDTWRQYQLRKHLSSPQHPFHMFPVGSRESLWDAPRRMGRDPRAELIDWWKRMCCAKRMKLVLLAQESLDTLEGWVRERFEDVPVRTKDGQQWLTYDTDVMEENQLGVSSNEFHQRIILITLISNLCMLSLSLTSVA